MILSEPSVITKISVLEKLAERWNDEGYQYAVTNGLQGYPDSIGRDLDVMFNNHDLKSAVSLTRSHLENEGFVVTSYKLAWVYWLVGIRRKGEEVDSVQIDFFDHLQWAFCWVIDDVDSLDKRERLGPFQVSSWASVGKRLIINALSGNYETFEKKPHYLECSDAEILSLKEGFIRISGHTFDNLQDAIASQDLEDLKYCIPDFRKKVMTKSLFSSKNLLKRLHSAWLKQWCVNINPVRTAPIINIYGLDDERSTEYTIGLADYIQKYIVFTCSEPYIMSKSKAGCIVDFVKIWKQYLRRDRRMSALQVIQIYVNHPYYNSPGKGPEKSKWFLPRPSFSVDISLFNKSNGHEYIQSIILGRLIDWFEDEAKNQLSV